MTTISKIGGYPSVCLNMIVKDESHIIEKTLEMLCSKICFSYWVICDTGSTDDTREIITNFFNKKHIPGELHEDVWQNFAHNRTLALNKAFDKTDLLFIFDADDDITGELILPETVDCDGYYLTFGDGGIIYQRVLLINNRIQWCFKSVIHEFIACLRGNGDYVTRTLEGNYHVISGRSGSRSKDPNKYLKDANILEAAYYEAKKNNDDLHLRYAFYCANSYKDAGMSNQAIKWYKITLENNNWHQEKYISCLYMYHEFCKLDQKETGMYYLVESFKYDCERLECVYHLIQHYCIHGLNHLAYQYYGIVKSFYENHYLDKYRENFTGKLFVEQNTGNFFLPYYMIIVADKVANIDSNAINTILKMYEIVFTTKCFVNSEFHIRNFLYNLHFFIEECSKRSNTFISLFQSFIDVLDSNGFSVYNYEFMEQYEKYGITFKGGSTFDEVRKKMLLKFESENDSAGVLLDSMKEKCKESKKILFYGGYAPFFWNYTYSTKHALGGSETALANLSKLFPSDYEIYVGGSVLEEKVCENVTYINIQNLFHFIKVNVFHTIIVSRYIGFYEMFPNATCYQSYIWGHDIELYGSGSNMNPNVILEKWSSKITGCVCQTEWHKNLFASSYPALRDKIVVINNGITVDKFVYKPAKVANRFIYTSCSERGLKRILDLWSQIIENLPDAELYISSYNTFPSNESEKEMESIIKEYKSIIHMGSLNKPKLYEIMSTAEYWLYPTQFYETSCITAMEMLMSEVICIYYPLAGLVDTLGKYGIQTKPGEEINVILNLTTKQKNDLKKYGKEYAMSCSWENRVLKWAKLLHLNTNALNTNALNTNALNTNPNDNDNGEIIDISKNVCVYEDEDLKKNQNRNHIKRQKWYFYYQYFTIETITQFIHNQRTYGGNEYDIVITNNKDEIDFKYNKVTFIFCVLVSDEPYLEYLHEMQCDVSILQTEPLNLTMRLNMILGMCRKYSYLKVYDYSKSNIKILNENNIMNCELLPYSMQNEERDKLVCFLNENDKVYDFAFIYNWKSLPVERQHIIAPPKRRKVIDFLRSNGYKVNIVAGYGDDRDVELSKCSFVLNIHGQVSENEILLPDECSNIFEHIRCDRLLGSGFNVLSETSYELDPEHINKYSQNLKILKYEDFFNVDIINKLLSEVKKKDVEVKNTVTSVASNVTNTVKKYCFIHSCNIENVGTYRLEHLVRTLWLTECEDVFDKIFIYNIGIPIDNTYGDKYEIVNYSRDITLFENPTINALNDFSKVHPDSYILYLHTKGVRYSKEDIKENDWINLMLYFLVEEYNVCMSTLDNGYDTVGCNYSIELDQRVFDGYPAPPPHYSGNFWWANTNYLKKLPNLSLDPPLRNAPEFWLFQNNPKCYNLHLSNVNHYHVTYPRNIYTNKNNIYNIYNTNMEEDDKHQTEDKRETLLDLIDSSRTDKNTIHSYLHLYEKKFHDKKYKAKNVLEIGIGPYKNSNGGSIKLWHDYFVNANVYALDILHTDDVWDGIKCNDRIKLITSTDAYNEEFFNNHFLYKNMKFDVLLDDGPHTIESIKQFITLYTKVMAEDGILVIEDVQHMNWIQELVKAVPEHLQKYIEVYDLRHVKQRYDDIVFIIHKKK